MRWRDMRNLSGRLTPAVVELGFCQCTTETVRMRESRRDPTLSCKNEPT